MVDLDTSGPDTEVSLPEEEVKEVVENTEPETEKKETTEKEKVETKDDEKLEDYSKGVQARIAKLTRKMRESERREQAARIRTSVRKEKTDRSRKI